MSEIYNKEDKSSENTADQQISEMSAKQTEQKDDTQPGLREVINHQNTAADDGGIQSGQKAQQPTGQQPQQAQYTVLHL